MADSEGPRIASLPFDEWDEDAKAALPRYLRRPELYLSGRPDAAPMPKVLGLFARHLPVTETWLAFSDTLSNDQSTLDPLVRELAVLRVAWRTRSDYQWNQHIRIGSHAGLTKEQLYAVPAGSDSRVWTPTECAILDAVDEIVDGTRIEDESWQALAGQFDETQLLELCFLIGSYLCLAAVINSVGLRADPPTEPIDAPALPPRER
jgi:4-carboxymuconolactone decarboxylase